MDSTLGRARRRHGGARMVFISRKDIRRPLVASATRKPPPHTPQPSPSYLNVFIIAASHGTGATCPDTNAPWRLFLVRFGCCSDCCGRAEDAASS